MLASRSTRPVSISRSTQPALDATASATYPLFRRSDVSTERPDGAKDVSDLRLHVVGLAPIRRPGGSTLGDGIRRLQRPAHMLGEPEHAVDRGPREVVNLLLRPAAKGQPRLERVELNPATIRPLDPQ